MKTKTKQAYLYTGGWMIRMCQMEKSVQLLLVQIILSYEQKRICLRPLHNTNIAEKPDKKFNDPSSLILDFGKYNPLRQLTVI